MCVRSDRAPLLRCTDWSPLLMTLGDLKRVVAVTAFFWTYNNNNNKALGRGIVLVSRGKREKTQRRGMSLLFSLNCNRLTTENSFR